MTGDEVKADERFQAAADTFSVLLDQFEGLSDPEIRNRVFALLQAVDVIHRSGLTRLAAYLRKVGHGDLLELAAQDEIVRTLLVLYDVLPDEPGGEAEVDGPVFIPLVASNGEGSRAADGV